MHHIEIMLWAHPVIEALATLLALFVLVLAMPRIMRNHFGGSAPFAWKRHVTLGMLCILLWFGGMVGGVLTTYQAWPSVFFTGAHYKTALIMLPFMAFGFISGVILDRKKKRRTLLPVLHGICNLALFAMAVWQAITGINLVRIFLLN